MIIIREYKNNNNIIQSKDVIPSIIQEAFTGDDARLIEQKYYCFRPNPKHYSIQHQTQNKLQTRPCT